MNSEIINKKMEIVKDFFNISNGDIAKIVENKKITKNYDFSKLSIFEVLKLSRKLNLSLDVLEDIFCVENCENLEKILKMYRATGLVRLVDELGRVVLPAEQRNFLKVLERDPVEISLDFNGNFVIKPFKKCIACGRNENIIQINEIYLCDICTKNYLDKKENK